MLEAKKAAVRQKLLAVQSMYLTAVVMEASAGRAKAGDGNLLGSRNAG